MHTGDFSVERDRASCSTIIQAALVRYVANLKQMKSQAAYRLYFALSEEMRVSHSPPKKKNVAWTSFCPTSASPNCSRKALAQWLAQSFPEMWP